eukprot:10072937-Ditylum_brightwellii.AAC.1
MVVLCGGGGGVSPDSWAVVKDDEDALAVVVVDEPATWAVMAMVLIQEFSSLMYVWQWKIQKMLQQWQQLMQQL